MSGYKSELCIWYYVYYILQLCTDDEFFTNEVWDTEQWAPYSWSDDVWVGYDNKQSILVKVRKVRNLYIIMNTMEDYKVL